MPVNGSSPPSSPPRTHWAFRVKPWINNSVWCECGEEGSGAMKFWSHREHASSCVKQEGGKGGKPKTWEAVGWTVMRERYQWLIALQCVALTVAGRQVTREGWPDGVCQWRERPSDWLAGCSVWVTAAAHAEWVKVEALLEWCSERGNVSRRLLWSPKCLGM